MTARDRPTWLLVYLTYPCPSCGVREGNPCRTASGKPAGIPHAARTQFAGRCPKCGSVVDAELDPGSLCPRCALVRSLEVERSTTWKRQDPE